MKPKKPRFKTTFAKYFALTAALITVSFILASAMQLVFARRYWIEEKRTRLDEQAQTVTAMVRENVKEIYPGMFHASENLHPLLTRFAEAGDINVLLTDQDYKILMCSHELTCEHYGRKLPSIIVERLADGDFFVVGGTAGGLYEEGQYITSVKLEYNKDAYGYVVVSASAKALGAYVADNMRLYALSALFVLMLAFVALYIMTYQQTRPLRQMAELTRQFGKGDFSGRVTVRGSDEVAELGAALNNMAVELSSVEEMRRSFVTNVSHDLKTPMTTITGFIDGILDGTIPREKHKEYLCIVSEETKRLSRLVTTMLNLSRIESGEFKLNPVRFDFTDMLCNTLFTFEKRIEEKHLSIEGLEDCDGQTVYGDRDQLRQAVYNLLDNAVKFTNENGEIRVNVTRADGRVYCTVRNTGDGIPAEELPHVFERFYKSDRSRGLDKTGTGLGLYIVKTAIDLHGGEITVRSVEGEFCEFVFWLPDSQKN